MNIDLVLITNLTPEEMDSIFSLVLLASYDKINIKGVITTHIYPEKKAQLAKLILSELKRKDIKVYIGDGIPFSENYDEALREKFNRENESYPPSLGYPNSIRKSHEKLWFPDFMKAYYEFFGTEYINNITIESMSAEQFLTKELEGHSPQNKLTVVSVAPLHDLVKIPKNLHKHMTLWCSGGGYCEDIENFLWSGKKMLKINRTTYNWGVASNITNQLFSNLNESNEKLNLLTPGITKQKRIIIEDQICDKWYKLLSEETVPRITKALIKDWYYFNREQESELLLVGPLMLNLAIDCSHSYIPVFTSIKKPRNYENSKYFPNRFFGEDDLVTMIMSDFHNTRFIRGFDDARMKNSLIKRIENLLFPLPKKEIVEKIKTVSEIFSNYNSQEIIYRYESNYCFWGIREDDQKKIKFQNFRAEILKSMNLPSGTDIIQIIGDSFYQTRTGTVLIKKFISEQISNEKILIEWGYTGLDNTEIPISDINQIVNELIDTCNIPSIANIVDFHTVEAIEKWGCSISRMNRHFILVFNKSHRVMFGDDTKISDGLCDKLICIEGGIQSFLQCVNALKQDKEIYGLYGTRSNNRYFSAAEFLDICSNLSEIGFHKINEYMASKLLFDKDRSDSLTKDKLFKKAWKKFMVNQLWYKVPVLCKIKRFDELEYRLKSNL